jgi:large subunit ribosomal protein L17
MRHHNANRKFGRVRKVRSALLKSLALSLVTKGKIKTTDAKARELRPYVEKLITTGKKDTVATRRLLTAKVGKIASEKIVGTVSPKYKTTAGGYSRITKLPARKSDGALMAVIELI